MKLFDVFRKKRKVIHRRRKRTTRSTFNNTQAIEKMVSDIEACRAQLNTVNIALKKHDDQLAEHRELVAQHSKRFEKLEEKVSAVSMTAGVKEAVPIARLIQTRPPSTRSAVATSDTIQKFDINRFSEQQKRILAVFFQNEGMALSYVDIGRILNKSPHTIKNQMREIRLKADLFETSIGEQSRHRFTFKRDLRIEKYLNVG
jgi:hypothetical protein